MEKDFSYDELNNLDSIAKVTMEIIDIYNILFDLDVKGKKDSDSYRTFLEDLKKRVKIEKDIYNKMIDIDSIIKYREFFENNCNNVSLDLDFMIDNFKSRDINYISCLRIIWKLKQSENILSYDSDVALKSMVFIKFGMSKFFSLLDDYINNCVMVRKREQLICYKYFVCYFSNINEELMLNSNFSVNNTDDISWIVGDEKDRGLFNTYLNVVKDDLIKNIIELLGISDEEFENLATDIKVRITLLNIRAYLMLLDEDTVLDINFWFHEYIESDEYLVKHVYDLKYKNMEKEIIEVFKKYISDRGKYLAKRKDNNKG